MSWTRNRECINRCCNPTCCFTNGVYSNYSQQTRFLSRLHHISYRAILLPTLIFLPQSRHFSESCIKTLSHIETVIKYLFKQNVAGGSKNAVSTCFTLLFILKYVHYWHRIPEENFDEGLQKYILKMSILMPFVFYLSLQLGKLSI